MPGGFHPPEWITANWPEPNYKDPIAKGHELVVIVVVLGTLATVFVSARLWIRFRLTRNAGLDDLFLFLALIPMIGISALLILIGAKDRWHRHIWDVPPSSLTGRQLHSLVVQVLFVFSTGFAKISTLLLYKRVVRNSSRKLYIIVVNAAVITLCLYIVSFLLLGVLQCRPTDAYWLQYSYPTPYDKEFTCIPESYSPLANAIVSIVTDFMTALLPMLLFKQLKLPKKEKVALSILFGVGFLICICGVVRTVLVHRIFYESYDVTWYSHDMWIWLCTETDLMIICAAIPPLKFLFERIFHPRKTKSRINTNLQLSQWSGDSNYYHKSRGSGGGGASLLESRQIDYYFSDHHHDSVTSHSALLRSPSLMSPYSAQTISPRVKDDWGGNDNDIQGIVRGSQNSQNSIP